MKIDISSNINELFNISIEDRGTLTWHQLHCLQSRLVALRSKDPSSKIGSVIVSSDHTPISSGYNGMARGVDESKPERNDREKSKYDFYIHSEINSIINAAKRGVSCEGATIYITDLPCSRCTGAIINSGITSIIVDSLAFENKDFIERWSDQINNSLDQINETNLEIGIYDLEYDTLKTLSKYLTL